MVGSLFGRPRQSGDPDEPEKLTTQEDIDLAHRRESLFDRRSRRMAREYDARFGRFERGLGLTISIAVVIWILVRFPDSAPVTVGGLGLGGGIGFAWHRHWKNDGGKDGG